eukprot:403365748
MRDSIRFYDMNNLTVLLNALYLLEKLMLQLDENFHQLVGTEEFITPMVNLLNNSEITDEVKIKILGMFESWGKRFLEDEDLPIFAEVFRVLQRLNLITLPEKQILDSGKLQTIKEEKVQDQNEMSETMKEVKRYHKLIDDMNHLKGNINLANILIDGTKAEDLENEDHCLNQLMILLNGMEQKICDLLVTLNSKDSSPLVKILILVLDDYNQTVLRFNQVKDDEELDPFIPGESFLHTIIEPTIIYERPETREFKNSLIDLDQNSTSLQKSFKKQPIKKQSGLLDILNLNSTQYQPFTQEQEIKDQAIYDCLEKPNIHNFNQSLSSQTMLALSQIALDMNEFALTFKNQQDQQLQNIFGVKVNMSSDLESDTREKQFIDDMRNRISEVKSQFIVNTSPMKKFPSVYSIDDDNSSNQYYEEQKQRPVIVNINSRQNSKDVNEDFHQKIANAFGSPVKALSKNNSQVEDFSNNRNINNQSFNEMNLFDLRNSQINSKLFGPPKKENDLLKKLPTFTQFNQSQFYNDTQNYFDRSSILKNGDVSFKNQPMDYIGRISLSSEMSSKAFESSHAAQVIKDFQQQRQSQIHRMSFLRITPNIINQANAFFGGGGAANQQNQGDNLGKGNEYEKREYNKANDKQALKMKKQPSGTKYQKVEENVETDEEEDDDDIFDRDPNFDTKKIMHSKAKANMKNKAQLQYLETNIDLFGDSEKTDEFRNTQVQPLGKQQSNGSNNQQHQNQRQIDFSNINVQNKRDSIQRALYNIL